MQAVLVNGGERYVMGGKLFVRNKAQDVSLDEAKILADEVVLDKRGNLVRRFRVTGGPTELLVASAPIVEPIPDPNPDLIVKTAIELEAEQAADPNETGAQNRGDMRVADLT